MQPQNPQIQAATQPGQPIPPATPPQQPQQPQQPDPSRAQPGQGDDFTTPGKSNEQANVNPREADEPMEPQLDDDEDENLELNDEDMEEGEQDDATRN